MSIYRDLQNIQQQNNSLLCVGLDLDPRKMPSDYSGSLKQMFEFAHRIIDATSDLVCAYKPNMAFYEHHGPEGLSLLKLIVERIPQHVPVILDGKRNDIGNTAAQYARALFETFGADWVTLNPYMGYDSMRPFLEYKNKGSFVLCLTSNAGSRDFQQLQVNGRPLYMEVAEKVSYWNKEHNCGLVVGATHPEQLREIREKAGDMPILIPGVGAQGGSLEEAVLAGTDSFRKPAVINVSRSVLYASKDADFAQRARQEVEKLNAIVRKLRNDQQTATQPRQEDHQSHPAERSTPSAVQTPRQQGEHQRSQDRDQGGQQPLQQHSHRDQSIPDGDQNEQHGQQRPNNGSHNQDDQQRTDRDTQEVQQQNEPNRTQPNGHQPPPNEDHRQ